MTRNAFTIRKAKMEDLERILLIYDHARAFMAEHGNPLQWGPTHWPPEQLIRQDIAQGDSYVCLCEDRIVGVFYFVQGSHIEKTYENIEDGSWIDEGPYGVVHRIATDGTVPGTGAFCLNWAYERCGHMRIDTHGDNVIMQHLVKKCGFTHVGTIHVEEDPYPRMAFEKI